MPWIANYMQVKQLISMKISMFFPAVQKFLLVTISNSKNVCFTACFLLCCAVGSFQEDAYAITAGRWRQSCKFSAFTCSCCIYCKNPATTRALEFGILLFRFINSFQLEVILFVKILCCRTLLPGQGSRKLQISRLHHPLEVLQNFHGSCAKCIPCRPAPCHIKSQE